MEVLYSLMRFRTMTLVSGAIGVARAVPSAVKKTVTLLRPGGMAAHIPYGRMRTVKSIQFHFTRFLPKNHTGAEKIVAGTRYRPNVKISHCISFLPSNCTGFDRSSPRHAGALMSVYSVW